MSLVLFILSLLSSPDSLSYEVAIAPGPETGIEAPFVPLSQVKDTETGQSYWARVRVRSERPGKFVLQGGNWYMRNMSFYDDTKRLLGTGNHAALHMPQGTTTWYIYYPFADEKSNRIFPISLEPELDFIRRQHIKNAVQVAFHSILVFLFLAAMVFALSSLDRVYLYYGLYILSIVLFFGYQYGLLGILLAVVNGVSPMWFWLFAFTITLFYAFFSIAFLDLKHTDPSAHKWMVAGIWYMLGLFVMSTTLYLLKVDAQHSNFYKIPTIAVELLLIGVVVYRIFRYQHGIIKRYYLTGALVLVSVSIAGQVVSTSRQSPDFNYYIQAGLLVEVFILFLGLGARVYDMQKKKNETQDKLIRQLQYNDTLQKEYTDKLEYQVNERTETLRKRSEENELLLKEIHHRVKNNLQMITSLLNMQERRVKSETSRGLLTSTKNKIKSIALIHEHLYSAESFSQINLQEYVDRLVQILTESLHKACPIRLETEVLEAGVHIETALPIGLILNELVTNSLKYALADNPHPYLAIGIGERNNALHITVEDNGPGKPQETKNGLGYTIISAILESCDGSMACQQANGRFLVDVALGEYVLEKMEPEIQK